jgi:2-polyprenyl-6-methoxyphenol hydroxylase-like FAD-dependent oxidoreductase
VKTHQVVIVGGGPVGVALAVELGLRGISCALVERYLEPQRIPKGQNLTPRTLERFYFWGVVDELRAARVMPPGFPMSGIIAYGDLTSEHWYAPPQRELLRPYYFQANERLPQYQMEAVLRKKMTALPNVETRFGWSAETIEQDDNGVRVEIAERNGPGREVLEADYVVGCDGSQSTVRQQVGIERSGADFDQMMVLAVFRSRELHEKLKRFPERATYNALHPALKGYWQFFGRIDVGEGWFFHAPVPADTRTDNYDFHGLIQKAAGFTFACEFDHVGFWNMRRRRALSGRACVHRRRCRPQPSALWWVRSQQRHRGRHQSRLEAGGEARGLGQRRPAKILQRGAPSDLSRDRRGLHRWSYPDGSRLSGALQPGARPRRIRAGMEGALGRRRRPHSYL